mmetsp:Transcript_13823/g.20367  ORF Transcript_13823/g.20367 Transcript_13823/m.20367 type:complete len:234 (-) Transcript_13823:175-876(-)|eukprot:3613896-Amphidinium_carterae.1
MMLLRLAIAVICLLQSVDGSKLTACLKHCQATLQEKGRKNRRAVEEADKCREKCLPHKETWEAEHTECYDDCMEGKVADPHNKRECSKHCHNKAVNDHANERYHHRFHKNLQDIERKKQGLPSIDEERQLEKHHAHMERLHATVGPYDYEAVPRLRECVAGCRERGDDWEQEVRNCNRECQQTHMSEMHDRQIRIQEHMQELHESGDLEDDDDVWGILKHHHSGPGFNGGLEL